MKSETGARAPRLSVRLLAFASVSVLAIGAQAARAQTTTSTTTTETTNSIKETVVTAERRTQNLQKVAAKVVAVKGADIAAQGKITTAQILEDVPNVTVGTSAGDNPNGNITIRGVQTTQTTGGLNAPPATATYVDDVYQGIGGDMDINQVEVLLGPQGTLYGRSATGGVVHFHTVDPVLGKYTGNVTGEYGSADLRQAMVGVNLPIGDKIAVRIAGREFDQHGYFNSQGGASRDQEARVKALYQPLSNLRFVAAWTINEAHTNSGGIAPTLDTPDHITYSGTYDQIGTSENRAHQYSLNTQYDFGFATLTWIAAMHDWVQNGASGPQTGHGQTLTNTNFNPLDQFHTEELRLASDPGSKLSWIVGASFYSNIFKTGQASIQDAASNTDGTPDTTPGIVGAPIFVNNESGSTKDYGIFTEETYPVLDNLRLTGGLRFDKTTVQKTNSYLFNFDLDSQANSLLPADNVYYGNSNTANFTNVTFKARVEYDLTPTNMLYGLVATGFLPGDQQLSPHVAFVPGIGVTGVSFLVLPFQQEKLTSYEIGSKNRFFDNSLQVNADVFYNDYAGYQEAANTAVAGPPVFTVIAVPMRMVGADFDATWRITPNDTFAVTAGILDAEITSYGDIPGTTTSIKNDLEFARLPGVPSVQATASYNHVFSFANGSTVTPRAQVRFIGGENLANLTANEVADGEGAYVHQKATAVADLGLGWSSPSAKYSANAYIRNVTNNIYKTAVTPTAQGAFDIDVTPANPRTYGVVLAAKF